MNAYTHYETPPDSPSGNDTGSGDADPPQHPTAIQKLFFWFAATSPHVIEQPECRVDWTRQVALGAMVAVVAGLAFVGATLASYYFLTGQSLAGALIAGGAWSTIILTLERLLLASSSKAPSASAWHSLALIAPRICLAIITALMVSVPFELVIFRQQLDVQVAVDHQQEVARQQQRLAARYGDIQGLEVRRRQFSQEIEKAEDVGSTTFEAAMCEGAGECGSGDKGEGPLYKQRLAHSNELKERAARIRTANEPAIRRLDDQIARREQARDAELERFNTLASNSDDLLTRLLALGHLEADPERGSWVRAIVLVIRLFFIALDVLPITSKACFRGAYDAAYASVQAARKSYFDTLTQRYEEQVKTATETERALGRASVDLARAVAEQAAAEALDSDEGKEARRSMQDKILRRIQKTVAVVFDDPTLDDEVRAAARRARRTAAEQAADEENAKRQTFSDLDDAARQSEQSLRTNEHQGESNG